MRFLFTCGGTAGHVNPALAVAGKIKEKMPDSEFLFIGAKGKMENDLVPRSGYDFKAIDVDNLSRQMNMSGIKHNAVSLAKIPGAIASAKKIIREFKPDVVVGTGGYVCFPVIWAACDMNIPTAIHESNAYPGLTTRLVANRIDKVMLGFEESRNHYKHPEKCVFTGTPVRGEFAGYTKAQAKKDLGIPENTRLVVSVWGSLGSGHMNHIMEDFVPYAAENAKYSLVHSSGKIYYEKLCAVINKKGDYLNSPNIDVRPYIFDMHKVMTAADIVMCRAGASTLSELTYIGKPAIIVPSPNVTNNHQEKNARVLEKAGGAIVVLEGEFDCKSLAETVDSLLSDEGKLEEMSEAMLRLGVPDACDKIFENITALLN